MTSPAPNFSINYAGNGMFSVTVGGETKMMNMADMDIALRVEQIEEWDKEIADQYAEIKESNLKRKQLNELLATMRKYKTEGRDDDIKLDNSWGTDKQSGSSAVDAANSSNSKSSDRFKMEGTDGQARSVDGWLDYYGLGAQKTDVQHNKSSSKRDAQWDANIELVKGLVDEISSDSELQMLRFRQLVDKRSTALQEAKSTMTAQKRAMDNVLQ
jgi:hypothetical protein